MAWGVFGFGEGIDMSAKSAKRQKIDRDARHKGMVVMEVRGYFVKPDIKSRFDEGVFVRTLDEVDLYLRCQSYAP